MDKDNSTYISFVRHGHVHNPANVFYGRLPRFRLSKEGKAQARSVAQYLSKKPIGNIFTSPLLRARQTATLISEPHDHVVLQMSRTLIEVHSPYDGQSIEVVKARNWDIYTGSGPKYEQAIDVLSRGLSFIAMVRKRHPGQMSVAVTHGEVVATLTYWATQRSTYPGQEVIDIQTNLLATYPEVASVTTFIYHTTSANEIPEFNYLVTY